MGLLCASSSRRPSCPCLSVACTFLEACCLLCTSLFANRLDKTTGVKQTQNININKQTNPFTHFTPPRCRIHTWHDFITLIHPDVRCHCMPGAALFGSYRVHICNRVSLLIDGVRELLPPLSDKALA